MPAVQSKMNFDAKLTSEDDNVKMRAAPRSRNKDRFTARKNENTWERSGRQKKKVFVPELDLKSLSPRSQNKKSHYDSPRKTKNHSSLRASTATGSTTVRVAKKRQLSESANAHSKSSNLTYFNKGITTPDCYVSEIKTSRSLFCLSPRRDPNNSLVDVENINPNQLPDNYFDCNEVDDFFRTQYPDFENSSEYEYETPKLLEDFVITPIKSVTSCDINNSPGVLRHFKDLLHQEETSRTNLLKQSEIALLKDIVKADERHRRLQRDDYELLKEILMGQLKEICQQERVIKIALKKIRCRRENEVEVTTLKVDSAEQPMEDTLRGGRSGKITSPKSSSKQTDSYKFSGRTPREEYELMLKSMTSARSPKTQGNSHRTPRQEVDIIFKNVPSLEKEIRILRSLGLKLEETLNKSTEKSPPIVNQRAIILHEVQIRYILLIMYYACSDIHLRGIQIMSGQVQEFQIRHQTIDELKLEREFFIPTDIDNFTLQRTDFHKLSRNPELLLRRLRPFTKGSSMKFNFIEQDPVFFNHFLTKMCKICAQVSETHQTFIPQGLDFLKKQYQQDNILFIKNGSGDHHPDIEISEETPPTADVTVLKRKSSSNSSIGKRKKKKHYSTPIPNHKLCTSKNKLIRNILFGTLQLSILFTLVTAIWYPDLICL